MYSWGEKAKAACRAFQIGGYANQLIEGRHGAAQFHEANQAGALDLNAGYFALAEETGEPVVEREENQRGR